MSPRTATVAAAAVLALLCGCSDDDDDAAEPSSGRAQPASQRCELVTPGQRVFVRLTGERAGELCEAWAEPGAAGSWTKPEAAGEPRGSFERVCVLYQGRTAAGLYAADSIASVAEAKRSCAGLIDRGWRELGRPDPALATDAAPPNPLLPVRCAEGRCVQQGRRVTRPRSGAECSGGRWTFALSRDQNFGVYRCR